MCAIYFSGNDIIHEMTKNADHKLKIVLTDFSGVTKYAEYRIFHVAEEANGYRIFVNGYTGTAGMKRRGDLRDFGLAMESQCLCFNKS